MQEADHGLKQGYGGGGIILSKRDGGARSLEIALLHPGGVRLMFRRQGGGAGLGLGVAAAAIADQDGRAFSAG
ncbi:hypothetical protein D3C87_1372160 [compost metagenome]